MHHTNRTREILSHYESDNPGVKANLARILSYGQLGGSGHLTILPVDQGFEHGPARSFISNPKAYDPEYHVQLALDAGLSAYAAPLGMLEAVTNQYAGTIPFILKLNSSNILQAKEAGPDQSLTASPEDAVRLGCSAVGMTIYPGSFTFKSMVEQARKIIAEAKALGLPTIIWSYPRGEGLAKEAETALDVIAYAVHIAALIGAHIIKVKLPTASFRDHEMQELYAKYSIKYDTLAARVSHVMQSALNGKRIVVFSGGPNKDLTTVYAETTAIKQGGGHGSIIGRNTFQRPRREAMEMLLQIMRIYYSR